MIINLMLKFIITIISPLQDAMRTGVEPHLQAIEARRGGKSFYVYDYLSCPTAFWTGVVEARTALQKEYSALELYPATWDLPYGSNHQGIYGATPPELLHQYDLGILKHAHTCFLAMVKNGNAMLSSNSFELSAVLIY